MKKRIAFALLMGSITTGIISFTVIASNLGFPDYFFRLWVRSWLTGYLVVIPAILIIGPLIQRVVDKLFDENRVKEQSIEV